eukprot:GHVU01179476.1.p2 GENE.GHVU01179476.1~~GHVU01179476.1.p2  ORF type:complete len:188 (+),score=33.42 GHVU01179476.1:131-694(+)
MTTLEKIGILGIRSFSPDNFEALAFEKPLTLIVGHNGAGKTTVVECLKMATTGQLPPNSGNGHAWINDPKLSSVPEVKAQIRLVFRTASEKRYCVTRNFQLLHLRERSGKLKVQFKALESVLQTQHTDGKKTAISKKCADLDSQVPMLMGVGKAILENVIFCHQDDSPWPSPTSSRLVATMRTFSCS